MPLDGLTQHWGLDRYLRSADRNRSACYFSPGPYCSHRSADRLLASTGCGAFARIFGWLFGICYGRAHRIFRWTALVAFLSPHSIYPGFIGQLSRNAHLPHGHLGHSRAPRVAGGEIEYGRQKVHFGKSLRHKIRTPLRNRTKEGILTRVVVRQPRHLRQKGQIHAPASQIRNRTVRDLRRKAKAGLHRQFALRITPDNTASIPRAEKNVE